MTMQDEVRVSQADVGWATSAAQHLCSPQDRDAAIRLLAQTFARHRAQAERDTLGRMEPVAWRDVVSERRRQIEKEGWSSEHDDAHEWGQMAGAAVCYALTNVGHWAAGPAIDQFWPWDKAWWKPTDNRRNLVKAAALLLAEIERMDRTTLPPAPEAGQ